MSNIKLSGEFQPNIYLDFGQGKVFSNRWAHGFTIFKFETEVKDNPLYVYAENDQGELYNTGYMCPRTVKCIDPKESTSIKVDVFKNMISIDTNTNINDGGVYDNYNGEFIHNFKNAGVNYYTKNPQSIDDLLQDITFTPQIVFMPQVRPVVKGGQRFGSLDAVSDGDLYVVSVLPTPDSYNRHIILCSDRRLFIPESYYEDGNEFNGYRFTPDENVIYYDSKGNKVENVDDYSAKFRVNGEFVSTLYIGSGTMVCLRTVVDTFNINGVDTEVVYWEVDNNVSLYEVEETGSIAFHIGDSIDYVNLPSKSFGSNISSDSVYTDIEVNTRDNPDNFENSIMFIEHVL